MDDTKALVSGGASPVPEDEPSQTVLPPQEALPDSPDVAERVRTVPYGALAEERARRKELQRELQESAGTRQRLQERLDALHALAGQAGPQAVPAAPDMSETVTPDAGNAPSNAAASAEASNAFRTQVLQSVRHYAAERPDFMDAYQHARQARVEELTALGYGQDEALAITFDNELEVINSAFAAGRNPAQVIYDFAVGRGYRPEPVGSNHPAVTGQGLSPRPMGGAAPMTEAQKIALAARGQAAAKSLSAAGGGSTGALTLEALAGMSDEEFAEATKGDRWHRLLRG